MARRGEFCPLFLQKLVLLKGFNNTYLYGIPARGRLKSYAASRSVRIHV